MPLYQPGLAPWAVERLVTILGANLLDEPDQEAGFRALCALGIDKPFECVGEAAESRALLAALAGDPRWHDAQGGASACAEVVGYEGAWTSGCSWAVQHCIPPEIRHRVDSDFAGRDIAILGFGTEGSSACHYLGNAGHGNASPFTTKDRFTGIRGPVGPVA